MLRRYFWWGHFHDGGLGLSSWGWGGLTRGTYLYYRKFVFQKLLDLHVQWNHTWFFEPPNNSNQKSFHPSQSNIVILLLISRTTRFFKSIFFPLEIRKSRFHHVLGRVFCTDTNMYYTTGHQKHSLWYGIQNMLCGHQD